MKNNAKPNIAGGFTLIEIIVAIAIIVILAAIGVGGFQLASQKKDTEQARIQISLLEKGIEDYKFDYGVYPGDNNAGGTDGTSQTNILFKSLYYGLSPDDVNGVAPADPENIYLSDLDPESNNQRWIRGSDTESITIVDPWGNEYYYRRGSSALNPDFDLWSAGPDGESSASGDGTPDDDDNISNF